MKFISKLIHFLSAKITEITLFYFIFNVLFYIMDSLGIIWHQRYLFKNRNNTNCKCLQVINALLNY